MIAFVTRNITGFEEKKNRSTAPAVPISAAYFAVFARPQRRIIHETVTNPMAEGIRFTVFTVE